MMKTRNVLIVIVLDQLVVKRSRTIKDADFPDRRPRPRSVGRKVVKKIEDEHENRTGDG
jgi:hypothetical protein